MQYSITKACLLALAAASSVVAQTAGFNVITKPTEGEVVGAGKTYTIEWIPTLPSQDVSLVVLQGASNITLQLGATIASGVPSSAGKYSWSAPADDLFAVYGIKIQLDSNPAVFQYSNQFKVAAAAPVVKPNPTTVKVSQVSTTLPAAIVDDIVAEGPKTLTQYETRVQTITSCAPSVTDCPYGKVTSTIIPVMPTLSTIIKHETVAANCSCTKGPDGKITSTGTAPVQIPTHYPTTIVVPAPYQNGTITHVAPIVPAPTGGVVVPTPETPAPSPETPAPSPEVPAQPEHSPEQEHPYAPIPSAPAPAPAPPAGTAVAPAPPAGTAVAPAPPAGTAVVPAPPAGTAAPSEAPVPTTPVFTGAAGKVASSLTLVGAAALSLMFL